MHIGGFLSDTPVNLHDQEVVVWSGGSNRVTLNRAAHIYIYDMYIYIYYIIYVYMIYFLYYIFYMIYIYVYILY